MSEEVKQEKPESPEFNVETLFSKGRLFKEYFVTKDYKVKFRTLTTSESLEVRNDPEVETGTSSFAIGVMGLTAAAYSIMELAGAPFEGTLEERKNKLKQLPAPVVDAILSKHAKFYNEVRGLFPDDPEKLTEEIEKK